MNEDKTAEQLRACPFCHGAAELDVDEFRNHFVSCIECRAEGSRAACASDAAACWNTRTDSGEAVAFDGPQDDRAMLLYLMQAFDTESWQCPQCGKDEECATMDSAYLLRDYLAAHPRATAVAEGEWIITITPNTVRMGRCKFPIEMFSERRTLIEHSVYLAAIASREGEGK